MSIPKLAIIGTAGVPAMYGGFETLAENLAKYHYAEQIQCDLSIYCSSKGATEERTKYLSSNLIYLPFGANGLSSIIYDSASIVSCLRRGQLCVLALGVSVAPILPFIRATSQTRVIVNLDGAEWKRKKWGWIARNVLRMFEGICVRFAHELIADNEEIARQVKAHYGRSCTVIAYGGDHAVSCGERAFTGADVPRNYAISICRIEPENNVEMILSAFRNRPQRNIVFIGNWSASPYGRDLRLKYGNLQNITLLDPIYDIEVLKFLRSRAECYVHGHSAGGTNPSLVEAMHFSLPAFCFDCQYNRNTTENVAKFFGCSGDLEELLNHIGSGEINEVGVALLDVATRKYRWAEIGREYFSLMLQNLKD